MIDYYIQQPTWTGLRKHGPRNKTWTRGHEQKLESITEGEGGVVIMNSALLCLAYEKEPMILLTQKKERIKQISKQTTEQSPLRNKQFRAQLYSVLMFWRMSNNWY